MKTLIVLLLVMMCSVSYAQEIPESYRERLKLAEKTLYDMKAEVDVMYRLIQQMYLHGNKRHKIEELQDVVFSTGEVEK